MRMGTVGRGWVGRSLVDLACAAVLLWLPGCTDVDFSGPEWSGSFGDAWNTDHAAEAGFRYRAASLPVVSLSGMAGSVEIVGRTDVDEIVVEGIRRVQSFDAADAREHLPELAVEVSASRDTVFVRTVQPRLGHGRSYQVEYRLGVPVGTAVTLRQMAGPVDIRSVAGNVEAHVTAGSLTLRDLAGDVRATAVAGGVNATLTLPAKGTVDLRSSAGDLTLSIPAETSAGLRAVTGSGTVRSEDLVLHDEDPRASVLQATMADGNGTIRLETAVGNITIKGR